MKKLFLKDFAKVTRKHLCQSLFFNNVIKKDTLAQMFFCEFCKDFKNSFLVEHLWWLLLHCLQSGKVDIKNEDVVQ